MRVREHVQIVRHELERGFTSRDGIPHRVEFCPVMKILREIPINIFIQ
jgi:hypothetical protein